MIIDLLMIGQKRKMEEQSSNEKSASIMLKFESGYRDVLVFLVEIQGTAQIIVLDPSYCTYVPCLKFCRYRTVNGGYPCIQINKGKRSRQLILYFQEVLRQQR